MRDEEFWQACVDAKEQLARRQSEFFQQATSKTQILDAALSAGGWQRGAALAFLAELNDDVALLPRLVDLAMRPAWARQARRAIVNIPREQLFPSLERVLTAELDQVTDEDDDYYSLWVALLAEAEAWSLLAQVAKAAQNSSNPDVQHVAAWTAQTYGALITAPTGPRRPARRHGEN
ncbi:hypothetical protein [Streptomyces sp. NPDC001594]|uniref:hypothetical protein n=1 Tax=Streptomyces sp. NPDC001594 TaxID=3364590 RepID=UPI0036775EE1